MVKAERDLSLLLLSDGSDLSLAVVLELGIRVRFLWVFGILVVFGCLVGFVKRDEKHFSVSMGKNFDQETLSPLKMSLGDDGPGLVINSNDRKKNGHTTCNIQHTAAFLTLRMFSMAPMCLGDIFCRRPLFDIRRCDSFNIPPCIEVPAFVDSCGTCRSDDAASSRIHLLLVTMILIGISPTRSMRTEGDTILILSHIAQK